MSNNGISITEAEALIKAHRVRLGAPHLAATIVMECAVPMSKIVMKY